MLYSQAKTKNQRSIQTIRDNTSVIDRFELYSVPDTVEVRRMNSRTQKSSQHFIVTLASNLRCAENTTLVKPLAEVAIRGEKLCFTVKPSKQYPDLNITDDILLIIEESVARYMASNFAAHIHGTEANTQDNNKECHLL